MPRQVYPYLATFAFALLLTGFALRKRGSLRHAWLMGTGMAIDLALVLTLEITRNAIATALGVLTLFQRIHVGSSTLAVVLYIPVFALGFVRLRQPSTANRHLRVWHERLGYAALALRTVGFIFMFSIVGLSAQ